MSIKILVKKDQKVKMGECPDSYWDSGMATGKVLDVNREKNFVKVVMPNRTEVFFDLDGPSWSHCGNFKRDVQFVK